MTHSTSSRAGEPLGHALGVGAVALHAQADSVSRPWRNRNALNGEMAAPMSRSSCTRALMMEAPGAEGRPVGRPW